MERPQISVARCGSYEQADVDAAVRRHFAALNVSALVRPDSKVVLKPNLLMKRRPEEGTTTHPALVRAVALQLRELGVHDIVIADSPGGPYTKGLLEGVYAGTGMAQAAKDTGARLCLDTGWQERRIAGGVACRDFNIIDPVVQADVVINMPKLKTHAMTTMSAAVKNLLGCVPGLQKPQLHMRFPEAGIFSRMLVDLSLLVKPAFTIVDAVVSMEGNGPSGGELRETGMTFASRDLYALDLALCAFIGMKPQQVHTVQHAIDAGLCPSEAAQLAYIGDELPQIDAFVPPRSGSPSFGSRAPGLLRPAAVALERRLSPRPVIHKKACIGCAKCAESCAPGAIDIVDKKAVITRSKCIRCFCCHEMCPVRAIDIKRVKLLDL